MTKHVISLPSKIRSISIIRAFSVIFFSLLVIGTGFSQQEDKEKDAPQDTQSFLRNSRSKRSFNKSSQQNEGLAKFLRFAVHDGNLVTGATINSGLLSFHYVAGVNSFRIGWPKGPQFVQYLHSAVFYVGAEVVDARGDTIHIISDNYRRSSAERSLTLSHYYGTMPLPKYFNLDQPGAIDEPLIGGISEDVGLDLVPNTGDEGEGDGVLQPVEDFNGNGVLDLSMKNEIGWLAISNRRETWPKYWPAGSYPGDDRQAGEEREGPRAGRWNGEFGALIRADQETYYVMSDQENDEFEYFPFEDDRRPWPEGRRGLGLITEVRGYQWNARLAEDIFIGIYDVTNHGKDLPKALVGMYVDPDLGGGLSGDFADFDQTDDITFAWNLAGRASNGLPIGFFGFAFLESPGLAHDGIDNDEDGLIDESQNNGIDDDGDWVAWEDVNGNGVWDNEDSNHNGELDPGEDVNGNGVLDIEPLNDDLGADGLGPEFDEYTGPDFGEANGVPDLGEPNFEFTDNDESDQVGLTSFYLRDVDDTMADDERYWAIEIQPGTFFTREGFQRDIAWTYGSGFIEFAGTERTHRYAIALLFGNDEDDIVRNKKTMQVIYDSDYNFAKAPRKPILTAVGDDKKVYLRWDSRAESAKDPIYGPDFEAYYIYKSTDPSFTEIKTITDAFGNPLLFKPFAIFDLKNGLKGPHPIRIGSEIGPDSDLGISYNMGTDSGLKHHLVDTDVTNGRTYFYAVVSLDQGYLPEFYPTISTRPGLAIISPTESGANIQVDPLGRPIAQDRNTATVVPTERVAGWVNPGLGDEGIVHTSGSATGNIVIDIFNPLKVKNNHEYRLVFGDDATHEQYDPSHFTGLTSFATLHSVTTGQAIAGFSDFDNTELADEYFGEGFRVFIQNDKISIDSTEWITGTSALDILDQTENLSGIAVARDYEIRIMATGADTSVNGSKVTNFQVWDVTDPDAAFKLPFRYTDRSKRGVLDELDRIIIVNNPEDIKQLWKWDFVFPADADSSRKTVPQSGDVLKVNTNKPFDRNDVFEFTLLGNNIELQKETRDLDNIYVVPDPYIAVNPIERRVLNEEEGRGERRIDFVNLPQECTITIFTSAGRLVRTLQHSATEANRRQAWDLRSKDGLEIATGVYFYAVESSAGTKTGKFAVIK